jgi:hypothetical protein
MINKNVFEKKNIFLTFLQSLKEIRKNKYIQKQRQGEMVKELIDKGKYIILNNHIDNK